MHKDYKLLCRCSKMSRNHNIIFFRHKHDNSIQSVCIRPRSYMSFFYYKPLCPCRFANLEMFVRCRHVILIQCLNLSHIICVLNAKPVPYNVAHNCYIGTLYYIIYEANMPLYFFIINTYVLC